MLAKFFHAQRNQVAGEQLGQRRGYRFQQGAAAHDVQVFIDGEARGRKDAGAGANLVGAQPGCFGEFKPALDSPVAGGVSVVIDDALAPSAAKGRIESAREDDRVFDGDDALVIVAVQGPSLELSASEVAFVHHQVEGMLVVIALLSHDTQAGAQVIERQQA